MVVDGDTIRFGRDVKPEDVPEGSPSDPPLYTEEDRKPENVKFSITTRIDGDVLDVIRKQAKERNLKYQTLINQTLREVFLGEHENVLGRLTQQLDDMKRNDVELLAHLASLKQKTELLLERARRKQKKRA